MYLPILFFLFVISTVTERYTAAAVFLTATWILAPTLADSPPSFNLVPEKDSTLEDSTPGDSPDLPGDSTTTQEYNIQDILDAM